MAHKAAQEAFDGIAERLGMTPFELADSMIPDFGFVKGQRKIAGAKPNSVKKTRVVQSTQGVKRKRGVRPAALPIREFLAWRR